MDKKGLRSQIETTLETALAEFGKGISEKKFKKHIKKASKLLSEGLALPEEEKVEKPVKKEKAPKVAAAKEEVVEIKKAPKKAPVKQVKKAPAPAKKKATAKETPAEKPAE